MRAVTTPKTTPKTSPAAPSPAAHPPAQVCGHIDCFGYAAAASGWVFIGWLRAAWSDHSNDAHIVAVFQHGRIRAKAKICSFRRPDLTEPARGVVIYISAPDDHRLGEFSGLEFDPKRTSGPLWAPIARPLQHLPEAELVARAQGLVNTSPDIARGKLLSLLRRRPFAGVDTLSQLPAPVHFEVDATILAPPDGLLVLGWLLDPTGSVASIRVRSGLLASGPIGQRWIRTSRQDVAEAFSAQYGVTDALCGFVTYAPSCVTAGEPLYVEIELQDGEIGYKRLPAPTCRGMAAFRRVLDAVHLTADEIAPAFDTVLGPPLLAINAARLGAPRLRRETVFGAPNPKPECSIIVPMYGRMDFLMYQLALMSEADMSRHEFIYVLDDPSRKQELLTLAGSAWQRYGIPFRVIALQENLGYGPANNVGLEHARGEYLCFLNSDVMPDTPHWLDLMVQDLRSDPGIGIVGGLLLFEDGTVQHEGMCYERLPEMANWPFPMHPNKGRLPAAGPDLAPTEAVTGACMVMRTDLTRELGGFDEIYAIGDFEDLDLCMRMRERGLRCMIDRRARMWHLERQSQVTPDKMWRMYVTLLNAWTHTKRWFPEPDAAGETAVSGSPASDDREAAADMEVETRE